LDKKDAGGSKCPVFDLSGGQGRKLFGSGGNNRGIVIACKATFLI